MYDAATPGLKRFAPPGWMRLLFLRNYDRLLAFSRKNGRHLGDAEDSSRAYLRSRRAWSESTRSAGSPRGVLLPLTEVGLGRCPRRKAREKMFDPAELESRIRASGTEAVASDIALSPEDQDLFRCLMSGRSREELCRELQVSPGALAVRICRAKKKLEACLGLHTVA
ncbi:MAG: hypothetical protein U0791_08175 [Gemmataceae bacterium]